MTEYRGESPLQRALERFKAKLRRDYYRRVWGG